MSKRQQIIMLGSTGGSLSGYVSITAPQFTGALTPNASAIGNDLIIDPTKFLSYRTITQDETAPGFTLGSSPAANAIFNVDIYNSDSAAHTIGVPSALSLARGTIITTTVIPAGTEIRLSFFNSTQVGQLIVRGDEPTAAGVLAALGLNVQHVFTEQGSAPSSPAAGSLALYAKTDHKLYTKNSSGTEVEVGSGSGGGSLEEAFTASALIASGTNHALPYVLEYSTSKISVDYLRYSNSTKQRATGMLYLPTAWTTSTIKFKVVWTAPAGTSGDATWGCAARVVGDNESIDSAYGTEVTVTDTHNGDGKRNITAWSTDVTPSGTMAAGKAVHFEINRAASGLADYVWLSQVIIAPGSS